MKDFTWTKSPSTRVDYYGSLISSQKAQSNGLLKLRERERRIYLDS